MFVNGRVVQKNSRKIGSMTHLFPKQKVVNISKFISFGNLLDREITCLVFLTTSAHLILSR